MILLFTIIAGITCVIIGALFLFSVQASHGSFVWYARLRRKADRRVIVALEKIYYYTHANRGIYKHQISHKSKLFLLYILKKMYIGLQYTVRFVRRNIILTTKKMQDSEPNEMLQELRKERDRILNDRS
jgi:uncharacterized pyridoxamine 5'-phosphate oxidase family protein